MAETTWRDQSRSACADLRMISVSEVDSSTPMKNLDDETALDDVETDPTLGARRAVQIRSW